MKRTISPATFARLSRLAARTRGEGHTVELRTRSTGGPGYVEDFYLIRGNQIVSRLGETVAETEANLRAARRA